MLRAMDSAVAGLRAHQNKLDVIGNNIANVNTFGFKSQSYSFKEAMYQTTIASTAGSASTAGNNPAQFGYGSMTGAISADMSVSTPSYVGGFNAAIEGQGFFIVSQSNSKVNVSSSDEMKRSNCTYTRVGQFSIDNNGYIVDSDNNFVMGFQPSSSDSSGTYETGELTPLRMTRKDGSFSTETPDTEMAISSGIQIDNLGIVTAAISDGSGGSKTVTLGKAAIATFQNPEGLAKAGGYSYETNINDNAGTCAATEAGNGSTPALRAGYVEASNVDLAKEFSELITTQRGFQANSKIITVSDEVLNELVNMKR